MKSRFLSVMIRFLKFQDRLSNWALVIFVILAVFLVYHYWYSISVSSKLRYPQSQRSLILLEQESIVVKRGLTQEEYTYKLGAGEYLEVLVNEEGSFYIAPKLGFYKTSHPKDGYGVGGVFVPKQPSKYFLIWEWPLKNENRSLQNPSVTRVLSMDQDQPEREWLLNPEFYKKRGLKINDRPLIDKDFKIAREKFEEKAMRDDLIKD